MRISFGFMQKCTEAILEDVQSESTLFSDINQLNAFFDFFTFFFQYLLNISHSSGLREPSQVIGNQMMLPAIVARHNNYSFFIRFLRKHFRTLKIEKSEETKK